MRDKRTWLMLLLMFLLGLGIAPIGANAQIGGFLKKKVKDVIKDPGQKEATAEQSGNTGTIFNDRVLELNPDNLAKVEKALQSEKDIRAGVETKYAKLLNRDEYAKCTMGVMMSPEAQALTSGDMSNMQLAQQRMQKLMALTENKCGKNPENLATAKNQELQQAKQEGAKNAGLTLTQYEIAIERITPFCKSGGQSKVKAFGEMYYVYTPSEVSAIQPKCSKLTGIISGLNGGE